MPRDIMHHHCWTPPKHAYEMASHRGVRARGGIPRRRGSSAPRCRWWCRMPSRCSSRWRCRRGWGGDAPLSAGNFGRKADGAWGNTQNKAVGPHFFLVLLQQPSSPHVAQKQSGERIFASRWSDEPSKRSSRPQEAPGCPRRPTTALPVSRSAAAAVCRDAHRGRVRALHFPWFGLSEIGVKGASFISGVYHLGKYHPDTVSAILGFYIEVWANLPET